MKLPEFKIGDEVICVMDMGRDYLKIGQKYKIKGIHLSYKHYYVLLKNCPEDLLGIERFKKIPDYSVII